MLISEHILNLTMVPVFLLSCWKIDLCKYHIYVWILQELLLHLLPGDHGALFMPYFAMRMVFLFTSFSWHFWPNTVAILALMVWQIVYQPKYVFEADYLEANPAFAAPINQLFKMAFRYVVITVILFHCFVSLSGYLYVEAEMPRIGNEKLLNSLEEGIFIVD